MDPAVPKATLKVLGLCVVLLVLVAAVTVSVAVMVWRSEAVGKLRGCRERAANESRELGNRVAELERERARLQREVAASTRAEDALQREIAQARGDGKKLNASLASCWEQAVGAGEDGDRGVLGHPAACKGRVMLERSGGGRGELSSQDQGDALSLRGILTRLVESPGTDGKDAADEQPPESKGWLQR
ncbi:uncharacterized protein M6G45_015180 [Spheniscus humboldti]